MELSPKTILSSISALALFTLLTGTAHAENVVARDEHGMPRCFQEAPGKGILFLWNSKDLYKKTIKAIPLEQISSSGTDSKKISCSQWKSLAGKIDAESKKLAPLTDENIDELGREYGIDSQDIFLLKQVERGAKIPRDQITAAQFIEQNKITSFDRELNRSIAEKFGIEFAGEIYREYQTSKPANKNFSQLVDQAINKQSSNEKTSLATLFEGIKIVIITGFMQAPANDRLKPLVDDLVKKGVVAEMAQSNPVGTIEGNVSLLTEQITERLSKGEKLILVAGSKGVPEMLGAIANIHNASTGPTPSAGEILAVVNLSGTLEGSFLIDWGTKLPQSIFVKKAMKKSAKEKGLELESFEPVENIGTKFLSDFIPTVSSRLPKSPKYFSLVGIPADHGLVRDKVIASLQTQVSRTKISHQGANDGYIEFPGTSIPESWGLDSQELIVNASHVILDGFYGKYDLAKDEDRNLVLSSFFQVIAQDYLKR